MHRLLYNFSVLWITLFKVNEIFMCSCICLENCIQFYFHILFICSHLSYRDNADDFIAAHRLSDMLVKVNLDDSVSRNQSSTVGAPLSQMRSVHGRPSEIGTGKKKKKKKPYFLTFPSHMCLLYVGIHVEPQTFSASVLVFHLLCQNCLQAFSRLLSMDIKIMWMQKYVVFFFCIVLTIPFN